MRQVKGRQPRIPLLAYLQAILFVCRATNTHYSLPTSTFDFISSINSNSPSFHCTKSTQPLFEPSLDSINMHGTDCPKCGASGQSSKTCSSCGAVSLPFDILLSSIDPSVHICGLLALLTNTD
jgi:ribosomal protein S27AE